MALSEINQALYYASKMLFGNHISEQVKKSPMETSLYKT